MAGEDSHPNHVVSTMEDNSAPADNNVTHTELNRRPSSTALNSPFHLQEALELGHPVNSWEYHNTEDELNCAGTEDDVLYMPGRGLNRYYPALRNMIPVRFQPKERKILPVDRVGFFSFSTFSWMTASMWKLYHKGSFSYEAYRCSMMEACSLNRQRFEYLWDEELRQRGEKDSSLFRVSWRFMRTRIMAATLIYTLAILGGFITPLVFLPLLVRTTATEGPCCSYLEGVLYALGILIVDAFRATLVSLHGAVYVRTGLRLRSAILAMVYHRVVNMNTLGQTNSGQILNMFSNDSARILEFGQYLHMWVAGLLSVLVAFTWIIWEFRLAGAIGVSAFLVFFFLQYGATVLTSRFRAKAVVHTDKRVQQTKEAMMAVKVIKINAWESVFHKLISGTRSLELKSLHKVVFLHLLNTAMSNSLPTAAALITFISCFGLGYELYPSQAFAALAVFMWCRHGLVFIPVSVGAISQVRCTMDRVKKLLLQPDMRPCLSKIKEADQAVNLSRATFAWERLIENDDPSKRRQSKTQYDGSVRKVSVQQNSAEMEALTVPTGNISEDGKLVEVLHNVNLAVPKGKLVGICGPTGSGKSSLLSAILGQLHLLTGDLAFKGTFAYVSQQPWLFKATVRENIIFGDELDPKRYYNAIRCCALNEDLHTLPAGDQTEVAEGGVTLSGGQKQRVALARAVYADRDIYLLDDPLASLDNRVSEHVFKYCIQDELRDKTILFVCSQAKFLKSCHLIFVLQDGRIMEQGTPEELLKSNGEYCRLMQDISTIDSVEECITPTDGKKPRRRSSTRSASREKTATPPKSLPNDQSTDSLTDDGRLVQPEEKGEGSISCTTYTEYVRAMGGFWLALGTTLSVIIFIASTALGSWYLGIVLSKNVVESGGVLRSCSPTCPPGNTSLAVNDSEPVRLSRRELPSVVPTNVSVVLSNVSVILSNVSDVVNSTLASDGGLFTNDSRRGVLGTTQSESETSMDMLVLGIILLSLMLTALLQSFIFSKTVMLASKRLHDRILERFFHTTMRFFETTPIGRILNIFAKDFDEIDFMLPTFLNVCISLLASAVISFMMVAAVVPWFLLLLPILGALFVYIVLIFVTTSREVKRRENVSRSPLFSHLNATLTGLPTIHAYEQERMFENEFVKLQDDNSTLNYLLIGSIRWVGFRLDLIVTIATTVVALLVVFLRDSIEPSFAALAIVHCSTLAGLLNYTVRVSAETQARFTNVERILRYEQSLDQEGADKTVIPPTPQDWPSRGQIVFDRVDLRYRENLPLALNGVSFKIEPREKVAIIGRTGSGKSSIGAALFRLVKTWGGSILIDDVDISRLLLHDVRSRMSIVPQDPVLFKGTLRFNVDPTNSYHDEEIWKALQKIHLHEKITSLDKQLFFNVVECGDNFSVGEKQLLCLARALLRNTRILFMDEATSAMDDTTDALIHNVLLEYFPDCTILTIAHRLQHIYDYNKVLVMDAGRVVEFDDPNVLAANPTSAFTKLMTVMSQAQNDDET